MKNLKIISLFCSILSLGGLVLLWEFCSAMGFQGMNIFPAPSIFIGTLIENNFQIGIGSQTSTIYQAIFSSIYRVIMGISLGFLGAIFIGFLISTNIWIKRFMMPIIQIIAPIAPIAWIPLALVLFGIGNATAIFIVFMGVFFMLTIATVKEIENVPENLIFSAQTLGASNFQIWTSVIIPSILPGIFTLLRLNFIAAWMAVLAAEMTGLRDGLGAIIMMGRNLFNHELILLGMVLIGVTGFFFDQGLKLFQEKFLWWDKLRSYAPKKMTSWK